MRRWAVLGLLASVWPVPSRGQAAQEPEPPRRAGLFALGPFWITPRLHLGTLGLDSNVFYTADHRRADFIMSGGPGLEIVLPTRPLRLELAGGLDYLYFARSAEQRRLNGDAHARLSLDSGRLQASLEEGYAQSFERPGFEVDRRVDRSQWSTRAELGLRLPGRLQLRTAISGERVQLPDGQSFLGADLTRTLERNTRRGLLGLGYRLTAKSALLLEGDLQLDRFPNAPARDTRSNRLQAGFELASPTRLGGRVLVGARLLRPEVEGLVPHERLLSGEGRLDWRFSPRTRLSLVARRDASFSAFESSEALPLLIQNESELRLERALTPRLELTLYARRLAFHTNAPVTLLADDGTPTRVRRDDRVHEAGLTLSERVGRRFKAGVTAGYTTRSSPIADLGISGLLLGGTLAFVP